MNTLWLRTLLLLTVFFWPAAHAAAVGLVLAPCRLADLTRAARCGTLSVPENPDKPHGRRLAIGVAVIPATHAQALADPIVVLQGTWPQMFRTIWGDRDRYLDYWRMLPPYYTAGDVATVDEDGYIAVLGRADDVMNIAGHRIGTSDVESALVSHPAVAEAGVISKPDPIKAEAIKAFVTLKIGQTPSDALKAQLIAHVRHELGPIATPSELEFVASLPKTRSGKIMRRVLKARELGIEPGDLTTIEE